MRDVVTKQRHLSLAGRKPRISPNNIHPMNYAHGLMFCFVLFWSYQFHKFLIDVIVLPISFRIASLALGQWYDCPNASEVTLKDRGKTIRYEINLTRSVLGT